VKSLHSLAWRAFLGDLHEHSSADAKLSAGLLGKVEPFDEQVRPTLPPRKIRAALGRGFSPIRSFQKDHAAPSVRSGLQRSTEIAGNALPLDQLRAIEHFDRPERTIVTSDAGNPSH